MRLLGSSKYVREPLGLAWVGPVIGPVMGTTRGAIIRPMEGPMVGAGVVVCPVAGAMVLLSPGAGGLGLVELVKILQQIINVGRCHILVYVLCISADS